MTPYFASQPLTVDAPPGSAAGATDEGGNLWWTIHAGQQLSLRGERVDVIRLGLRARASGVARTSGARPRRPSRAVGWQVPARAIDGESFTAPEWIRIVPAVSSGEIRIEVMEGTVAIAALGYQHKTDVFDITVGARNRQRQLDVVPSAADRIVDALVAITREPSAEHLRALSLALEAHVPPLLGALGYAEASRAAVRFGPVPSTLPGAASRLGTRAPPRCSCRSLVGRSNISWRISLRAKRADDAGSPWTALASASPIEDDAASVRALAALLYVPADGARPLVAPLAERYAAAHPELERAARRAREAWVREGPWREAPFAPGTPIVFGIVAPIDNPSSPMCNLEGPGGQRWTLLADPVTPVDVDQISGTHARVLLRSASNEPERESTVAIDHTTATVHAAAGLVSVLAMTQAVISSAARPVRPRPWR